MVLKTKVMRRSRNISPQGNCEDDGKELVADKDIKTLSNIHL